MEILAENIAVDKVSFWRNEPPKDNLQISKWTSTADALEPIIQLDYIMISQKSVLVLSLCNPHILVKKQV